MHLPSTCVFTEENRKGGLTVLKTPNPETFDTDLTHSPKVPVEPEARMITVEVPDSEWVSQ